MHDKLILTDADGVLLDWLYGFTRWMQRHGFEKKQEHVDMYNLAPVFGQDEESIMRYIKMFNESASIGYLSPNRDAVKYVKKLHEEHGFVFHCITKIGVDRHCLELRKFNLYSLFGETVFEDITCIDFKDEKRLVLEQYRDTGCNWVEDSVADADVGSELGLNSYIMNQVHNRNAKSRFNTPRVNSWKEIYDMIT